MHPHLIIDFSSRNILPLIVTPKGRVIPCTLRRQGMTSRCFSAEIYLAPERYQKGESGWLPELNRIIEENGSDIFFRGESAGWFRPHQISAEESVMPVRHPLYALSSHRITEGTDLSLVANASSAFLAFLLQPVLNTLRDMGFQPEELNVIALVPAYLSRLAERIVYKVLKKMGSRRVILLNHAVALAMHFLKLSYMQKVGVLHTDENALHVSRIAIEREDGDHVTLEHAGSRSIKEAGWDSIANQIALSLYRDALLPRPDKRVLTCLNRALSGLFGGMLPTDIPTDPGLPLSYGMLTKKLGRDMGERIRDETSVKLRRAMDALELNDAPFFITAGPFFMIGQFEKLMLNPVGKCQPAKVRHMLAMERTAHGIVAMLNWLRETESRRITVRHKYSIGIAATEDCSIELIPGSLLQFGRERRTIKQILSLDSEYAMDRDLLVVDILWGNNPIPRHNTSLCTLSYEVTGDDIRNDTMLELMFDVKATAHGLRGKVTATLGGREPKPPKVLDFTRSGRTVVLNGL